MAPALRILHLEDEPRDSELMGEILRREGIACDIARVDSRAEFLQVLQSESIDVVISDLSVPGFDGISAQEVWQTLRPSVPFIFLSGTFGESVALERLNAGATDYVLKDRVEKLPDVVRRALRAAQARTDHQHVQENLHRLTIELEHRVEERTAQLGAANQALVEARNEAERANRAKSEFLSRMSHDLRTPLNAVLGFAQLLDMENLTTDQRESVTQILKAGRHLLGLMNEVLDISRIEAGHLSLSLEPVPVDETIAQVVELLRPLAAPLRIEIDVTPGPGAERFVRADRQRLNQILLNLVSNAIKYNRDGGRVTLSCAEKSSGNLRITVADTGPGIRPEKLALLFTPFERLGADQSGIEGTGLGLALSRGLVEAMGGAVGVDSQVDRGSSFWVELARTSPIAQETEGRPRPTRAAGLPKATSGTVLYIEDNASNVSLVERLFRQRRPGITLLHASDGEAGIVVALQHKPDLILLDLHLPDKPGEEVLRKLWADARTRDIPVAILSADATTSQSRRLMTAGATAYLTKPLDVSRLLALLDERFTT